MKLLDRVRHAARAKHFSYRTEQAYVHWCERFIRFHNVRHPDTMGAPEVEAFLTHLAVDGRVSASTQNQALAALLFLYRAVLARDIGRLDAVRAVRPKRLPAVLSRDEVRRLLGALDRLPTTEPYGLMGRLMYGAGLRLMECCRLRMKDVDLDRGQLTVRGGKGDKDRFSSWRKQRRVSAARSMPLLDRTVRAPARHLHFADPVRRTAWVTPGTRPPRRRGAVRPRATAGPCRSWRR
jgi:integrase